MKHHCLTCLHEPNWFNNLGKCKLCLKFKSIGCIQHYRCLSLDFVSTECGVVIDCPTWKSKV